MMARDLGLPALLCLFAVVCRADDTARPSGLTIEHVLVTPARQLDVPAQDTGVLTAIPVSEGQTVRAGSVLAMLDDTDARLNVVRAQLELDAATTQSDSDVDVRAAQREFDVAEAELRRAIESRQRFSKAVSQTEIDRLELLVARARLQIEQAELERTTQAITVRLKRNALEAATSLLDRRRVNAPLSGVIVQMHAHEGEWVTPGTPVLRILQLSPLRAEAYVSRDIDPARLNNAPVRLRIATGPDMHDDYSGRVTFVSPEVNVATGQIRIRADIDNADFRLRPGSQGTLEIQENRIDESSLTEEKTAADDEISGL